ncbi:rhomboid family intramembrane serine protease [Mucilaginibacter sp. 44-25]|uniref:rhomboid family intramembrane serine protease n=1 Tax=Mucilaginibacter sp. 44-25 TaxID=1895794 RepID=UPI0009688A03|nr:rhomboid family intramembrane serine protease [Mucilaginibacter sp. 44-25]OJW15242.1 MAG: hypothetical protein BGO48_14005 [Mucilaginibacter sp. 44-25]
MAWGISPRKTAVIPLNDYNPNHYLTLLYYAFNNLNWRVGYFDRDGIIGYTKLSWQSYAEEISVRILGNNAVIKSECVGYQFFFTDYDKNAKNLELLYNEISYVEFHLKDSLQTSTQELIDSIPDNQFIRLDNPPLGYKEKLMGFLSVFKPAPGYTVTPVLVLLNIAIFFITWAIMIGRVVAIAMLSKQNGHADALQNLNMEDIYLSLGFNNRTQVLSGQVWRLITGTFLHFSLLHIAGNMLVLIYIGSLLESKLGKWNYLILYLLTGICASITSVVWNHSGVMAGASGAIFGLFGILLALLSTNFYEANAKRALLISTAIFVAYSIIPIGRQVDHAAHFGGLLSGYAFGWLAYLGLKHQKTLTATLSATAFTVLATAICIIAAPVYQLKELSELGAQTQRLTNELNQDFYYTDSLNRQQRLQLLSKKSMLKVDTLGRIGKNIGKLRLPEKQHKIALIKSKIIDLEQQVYRLLYLEFKEDNKTKYRQQIYSTTNKINDLRSEWGTIEDAE